MLWAVLMTRFEELARIQAAIKHRNQAELRWAVEYCQVRLRIVTQKDAKCWRSIQREGTDALRSLAPPTT
jgi:hypothetical protein